MFQRSRNCITCDTFTALTTPITLDSRWHCCHCHFDGDDCVFHATNEIAFLKEQNPNQNRTIASVWVDDESRLRSVQRTFCHTRHSHSFTAVLFYASALKWHDNIYFFHFLLCFSLRLKNLQSIQSMIWFLADQKHVRFGSSLLTLFSSFKFNGWFRNIFVRHISNNRNCKSGKMTTIDESSATQFRKRPQRKKIDHKTTFENCDQIDNQIVIDLMPSTFKFVK